MDDAHDAGPEDELLVVRLRGRDLGAFEALYDRCRRRSRLRKWPHGPRPRRFRRPWSPAASFAKNGRRSGAVSV